MVEKSSPDLVDDLKLRLRQKNRVHNFEMLVDFVEKHLSVSYDSLVHQDPPFQLAVAYAGSCHSFGDVSHGEEQFQGEQQPGQYFFDGCFIPHVRVGIH